MRKKTRKETDKLYKVKEKTQIIQKKTRKEKRKKKRTKKGTTTKKE